MVSITVGASGVGKSTYINSHKSDNAIVISPDNERRNLSSVNDQSVSYKAFSICFEKLRKLKDDEEIWFDATSLSIKSLNNIIKNINTKINLYLFENSRNPEFCKNNIKRDMQNGVERSNTPDEVIDKMSKRYIQLVDSKEFNSWVITNNATITRIH